MTKWTNKSYDICARGPQDNPVAVNSSIGAAGAAASATLTHDSTNTYYITGFSITSTNPAATQNGAATVTGLVGNATLTYEFVESAQFGGNLQVSFPDPIPAKDTGTDIVVTCPAIASGGVVSVTVFGYKTQY